jgi:serine/threonine-protein kinase
VGPYEPVCELARGHLGTAWAARVTAGAEAGKIVTLRRIVSRQGIAVELVERICEAARLLGDHRSPKLQGVLDVVVADGSVAVVSEYVEGESLRSLQRLARMRRTPVPSPVALRVAADLLEALESIAGFAHDHPDRAQLLCGGLSPERVLVTTRGDALLADLELLGALAGAPVLAQDQDLLSYRAPEHVRAGGAPDARSDLFVAGILLWEMLSSQQLFAPPAAPVRKAVGRMHSGVLDEVEVALAQKVLEAPIPRLDDAEQGRTPKVSAPIADVVARALAREPSERFARAAEMREALVAAAGEGGLAQPPEVAAFVDKLARLTLLARRSAIQKGASERAPGQDRAGAKVPAASPEAPAKQAAAIAEPRSEEVALDELEADAAAPEPQAQQHRKLSGRPPPPPKLGPRKAAADGAPDEAPTLKRDRLPLPPAGPAQPAKAAAAVAVQAASTAAVETAPGGAVEAVPEAAPSAASTWRPPDEPAAQEAGVVGAPAEPRAAVSEPVPVAEPHEVPAPPARAAPDAPAPAPAPSTHVAGAVPASAAETGEEAEALPDLEARRKRTRIVVAAVVASLALLLVVALVIGSTRTRRPAPKGAAPAAASAQPIGTGSAAEPASATAAASTAEVAPAASSVASEAVEAANATAAAASAPGTPPEVPAAVPKPKPATAPAAVKPKPPPKAKKPFTPSGI